MSRTETEKPSIAERLEVAEQDARAFFHDCTALQKRLAEAEEKLEFYADVKNFTVHSRMIGEGPGHIRNRREEIRITWPWMEARGHLDKHKKD